MRHLAHSVDYSSFRKGAPSTAKYEHVKHMYDAVRANMNLHESFEDNGDGLFEDSPKTLREFIREADEALDKSKKGKGSKFEPVIINPDTSELHSAE